MDTVKRTMAAAAVAALCAGGARPAETGPDAEARVTECRERARAADKAEALAVAGRDGWIFFTGELRHMGAGRFWESPDGAGRSPLIAITNFHAQLTRLGIGLLVVPVPPKVVVYPDRLLERPGPARWDVHHRAFYALLRDAGVPVLDLTDEFIAARDGDGTNGPVYCRQDTHWSPRACAIAAERIAAEIRKFPWFGKVPGTEYRRQAEVREITGDLWTLLGRADLPKESVTVRTVSRREGDAWEPPKEDEDSPVVLLADSHGLVFHAGGDLHASHAGLADHLSAALGFDVDTIARRGSAANSVRLSFARNLVQKPGYQERKKFVVWCFTAREFTESGAWQAFRITRRTE